VCELDLRGLEEESVTFCCEQGKWIFEFRERCWEFLEWLWGC